MYIYIYIRHCFLLKSIDDESVRNCRALSLFLLCVRFNILYLCTTYYYINIGKLGRDLENLVLSKLDFPISIHILLFKYGKYSM